MANVTKQNRWLKINVYFERTIAMVVHACTWLLFQVLRAVLSIDKPDTTIHDTRYNDERSLSKSLRRYFLDRQKFRHCTCAHLDDAGLNNKCCAKRSNLRQLKNKWTNPSCEDQRECGYRWNAKQYSLTKHHATMSPIEPI